MDKEQNQKIITQLGKLVVKYRKLNKLNQEEFAERIGIHYNQVGRIERGESDFKITTLIAIFKDAKKVNSLMAAFKSLSEDDPEEETSATL